MTIILIIITAVVSITAFEKSGIMGKYQLNAYQVVHRKQWYRLFTHAFLHANWTHLIVNMLVLYFFGSAIEEYFRLQFGAFFIIHYLILYIGAIAVSSLYSLVRHKDNYYYNAVGASGATSAVLFAFILFNPLGKIYLYFAIPIPGVIFGILYLIYSQYMSKRNVDNIGHDAHFWGGVFGFFYPVLINSDLIIRFGRQITSWFEQVF